MGITLKELKAQCSDQTAALNADVFDDPGYLRPNRTIEYAALRNAGDLGAGVEQALEAMQPNNALAAKFEHLWAEWGGLPLTKEYKFSSARRWRADYCHTDTRTIIELEGGIYSGGRHVRAEGYRSDVEKYNAAAMLGYTVLRLGTGQVDAAHVAEIADYVRRQMQQVTA
jgi:very-short-patch-repair endonuclease